MKKVTVLAILLLVLLVTVVLVSAESPDPLPINWQKVLADDLKSAEIPTEPCDVDANLLVNPSFEGQYAAWIPPNGHPDCPAGICTTAQMAGGWTPFWRSFSGDPNDTDVNPEYKPAESEFFPNRVHSGERAQQYFTFYRTHEAGLLQQVSGLTPGVTYCFSIWGHSWSDGDDDGVSGPQFGILQQKVGIDPTGGDDWRSNDIIWSAEREQYDEFGLFKIEVEAQSEIITVYAYSNPVWSVKHNDVYWDDAVLSSEGPAGATLSISPASHALWAEVDNPDVISAESTIDIANAMTETWQAVLEPGGTFVPDVSPLSGDPGDDLTLTVDTIGMPVGVYTASVTIVTDPPISDSPGTVALELYVVEEINTAFAPVVARP
ncbi:MAG: hypothetical protein M9928_10830 [Anaerolineae bacterium]|nr:hypothetical protein [Anaerolineae bacterium]MCO5205518.1 hypothetical protein [Anaerolineae bacterium]